MIIKLKITQEDISNANRLSWAHCPVALALKRKGYSNVSVRRAHLYFTIWEKKFPKDYCIPWPRKITNFIGKYDEGKEVKPFSVFIVIL